MHGPPIPPVEVPVQWKTSKLPALQGLSTLGGYCHNSFPMVSPICQGLSNPTPTFRLTQIHHLSLGNHWLIRPELRSSGRSQFSIHTLHTFIQTPLGQVRPSSYIVHLMQ